MISAPAPAPIDCTDIDARALRDERFDQAFFMVGDILVLTVAAALTAFGAVTGVHPVISIVFGVVTAAIVLIAAVILAFGVTEFRRLNRELRALNH